MKTPSFRDLFENVPLDFIRSLDDMPVGIYRSSLEGKLVAANKELARIFGFDSLEEFMEYPLVNLYRDKKDRGAFIAVLSEKRFIEDLHLAFYQKGGSPIDCMVTACGVFDRDNELIYIDGIIRDITQEKVEKKANSRHHRLRGVQQMAGGIGHQLNQPLTVLNNLISELMTTPETPESSKNALKKIQEQVRRLNDIAQKIQNIKHVEMMDYVAGVQIVDIDRSF
ncbi:hypothetical protein D3OALGA1CA_4731 [Olavius algarvensis associated proteobacterium Delta 3]|nr:hypothetical protein D3OALGA1CA_4731 [Olavius algarvensis associated proteobacterium Delta 3]